MELWNRIREKPERKNFLAYYEGLIWKVAKNQWYRQYKVRCLFEV